MTLLICLSNHLLLKVTAAISSSASLSCVLNRHYLLNNQVRLITAVSSLKYSNRAISFVHVD